MARIRILTLCIRAKFRNQTVRKVLNAKVHGWESKTYGTINKNVPILVRDYFKLTIAELTSKIDEMVDYMEETTETRSGALFRERFTDMMEWKKAEKIVDGYIERSRHNVGPKNIERDNRILELYDAGNGREEIRAIIKAEYKDDISLEGISHAKRRALARRVKVTS
jgi:hypothetical protein